MLVMPSLRSGGLLGVKIITIQPTLTERPGGATRAIYVALDAKSGELKGLIDGHALTLRRTAATSLLAAQALARPNPRNGTRSRYGVSRKITGASVCRNLSPTSNSSFGEGGRAKLKHSWMS